MDVMGGMFSNVTAAMGEAVDGSAVVVPVLTERYEKSYNCKRELNYANDKRRPFVPVLAQQDYTPSGEVGVITAGLLWTPITPSMSDAELKASVDSLERELLVKGVQRFPEGFVEASRLDEGREQEQRLLRDQELEKKRKGGAAEKADKQVVEGRGEKVEEEDATTREKNKTGAKVNLDTEAGRGAEEQQQSIKRWLMAVHINALDAVKYTVALSELFGVDAVDDMFSLEPADLQAVGMKKVHLKKVQQQLHSGVGTAPSAGTDAVVTTASLSGRPGGETKPVKVFLSHAWANDKLGRNNHDRVARINRGLQQRKIATWFDDQGDMKGNTLQAMTNGIDECSIVIVFVTREYIHKVHEGSSRQLQD
jgi:hypothetical protein